MSFPNQEQDVEWAELQRRKEVLWRQAAEMLSRREVAPEALPDSTPILRADRDRDGAQARYSSFPRDAIVAQTAAPARSC
jgi:hypothetical protein